ncbi:MAG TPA: type II secretion system protein GspM [Woeseiaceae bacterium]|nr:type II secretion system protein GspM [Woeseiaceae bacterium]
MIEKLDKKQRKQLAIGILAAAVIAVLTITAGPVWVANASRQAALDEAHERLQRYEQISARDRELLPQYEALLQKQRSAGNHLRSETSAVAGAELQRLVKTITATNQAQILSTQLLPVSEEQGFLRVALKVRLRGELPAILQSLYDIETDDVYMFVDNIALRDNMSGRSQYRGQLRPMDAEFELIAYMPEAS